MNLDIFNLSEKELLQYNSMKKSKLVAYLIGAFFGWIGLHRLYLEDYTMFWVFVGLFVMSWVFPVLVFALGLLQLIDFICTYFVCNTYNQNILYEIQRRRKEGE